VGFVDEPWRNTSGFLDAEVTTTWKYEPSEETRKEIDAILDMYAQDNLADMARTYMETRGQKVRNIVENNSTEEAVEALMGVAPATGEQFTDAAVVAEDYSALFDKPGSIYERRLILLNRVFMDNMDETDGFWSTAGALADVVISSPANSAYDAVAGLFGVETRGSDLSLRAEGEKLYNMALDMNLSDDEFVKEADTMVKKWKDAGLFTESNPLILASFMDSAMSKGKSEDAAIAQIFGTIDVLTMGVGAGGAALSKIGRRVGRPVEAAKAMAANAPETAAPSILSPVRPPSESPSISGLSSTISNRNAVIDRIREHGILNDLADLDIDRDKVLNRIVDELELAPRRINDVTMDRNETGIPRLSVFIGKVDGKPWVSESSAKKFAESIGGSVVRANEKGKTVYLIRKDELLQPTQVDPTDIGSVYSGSKLLSSISSTRFTTEKRLDNILKTGESRAAAAVTGLMTEYRKILSTVSSASRKAVDNMIALFRDEPSMSVHRRVSTGLFERKFRSVYNREPTEEELELFKAAKSLMDSEWLVEADRLLRLSLANNEVMVRFGKEFVRAKRVDGKKKRLNMKTGKFEETDKGFLLASPVRTRSGREITEITGVVSRTPTYSDVLPYNFGGHRYYRSPARFFVKAVSAAGATRTRTFMAVSTEAEAKKTITQIRNILSERTDEAVLKNNEWNPDIETMEDFESFLKSYGIEDPKDLNYFSDAEDLNDGGFILPPWRMSRRSRPLAAYGGGTLETENPLATIDRSLTATLNRRAEAKYMYQAVAGWISAAEKAGLIVNSKELKGLSDLSKLRKAVLPKDKKLANALRNEREVILRRLSQQSEEGTYFSTLMHNMAEMAFEADRKKIKRLLDWTSTKEPLAFVRWLAFNTKLGMFNIRQLWLQSSQLLNSAAIVSSTIGATKSARTLAVVPALRAALVEGIPAKALEHIAKTQSVVSGIPKDDFINIVEWTRKNGRHIVARTFIEDNLASGPAVAAGLNKFVDVGQVFFREGELLARLGSVLLSYVERRKLTPNLKLFDEGVTESLIGRQDELFASMTRASSANWQRDVVGSTVLQFTSYNIRMFEQMFSGRILTRKERARLFASHALFYGVGGFIPLYYSDTIMNKYFGGNENAEEIYDYVRRGFIDGTLSAVTGVETDVASSIAPVSGMISFLENIYENPIGAGPSIFMDAAAPIGSFAKNVVVGDIAYAKEDLDRALRTISSWNNTKKMIFALKTGEYRSMRTGTLIVDDVNVTEALMLGMGIPLSRINDTYNMTITYRNMSAYWRQVKTDVGRIAALAAKDLENDDMVAYEEKMKDMGMLLNTLPASRRERVLKEVMSGRGRSLHETMIRRFMINGLMELDTKE